MKYLMIIIISVSGEESGVDRLDGEGVWRRVLELKVE